MDKPFILEMAEAENELVAVVNDIIRRHNIPCYYMELLVDKIHNQLKSGAKDEIARAKETFILESKKAESEEV